MQQKLDLSLRGLYTAANNFSGIPQGALEIADNVVINAKNLIESRRGQTQYGNPLAIGSDQVKKLFNFGSSLVVNYDDKMAYDSGDGNWVNYPGTYLPPESSFKIRSLEAQRNFYFTSNEGIWKIDALAGTPRPAGVVRALGGTASLTGSAGFLDDDSAVAYRLVWGYRDANNNLILGAPSQRLVIANSSGGSRDVILSFNIPDSITTEYFYQIYRSFGTASATDEPEDNLQLVLEDNPTLGEITAKVFTVTDPTPYSLMRAALYTNPNQQGIANANNPPPFAVDVDVYKNCAFYANTKQKQTLSLAMISVDSPSFGFLTVNGNTTNLDDEINGLRHTATAVIQDLTYTAVVNGVPGNDVSIEYTDGGTAGSEVVTVNGSAISIQIEDGVSTATNIKTAFDLVPAALALATVAITGTGSNPQDVVVETSLEGGTDTSLINLGMRVVAGGVPAGSLVVEIVDADTVRIDQNATATATVSIEFQDRFTIGSIDYWAGTTQSTSTNTFILENSLSPGQNINDSAENLIQLINTSPSNTTLYAYYISGTEDLPGQILFEERGVGGAAFTATSTAGGSFSPTLPTSGTSIISNNDEKQNRVYISKPDQVEAVPVYRFFDIGSANFPIQRCIALRDGIFFFKQDGVFRLSGESFESFNVTLQDNTVVLKVPESAVPFNNQIFCFTTQGICAVTDSGVKIMSVPIEDTLLELSSEQYTNFVSASFGVAYESARLYMFFTVTEEDDEHATQAYIYNSLTDSWTRWIMNRTCGVVNPTVNKLFMAKTDSGQILIERKSFTNADYADEEYAVIIDSVDSDTEITLTDASVVTKGMTIVQGVRNAVIDSIDGNTITVTETQGMEPGAATVYTPIKNKIEWSPIDAENPGILKQFSEVSFFFKDAAFREIGAGFETNVSLGVTTVPILSKGFGAWGIFPWGSQPWGGVLGGQIALRTYVPRDKQRASWLKLGLETNEAFTGFSLQGVSVIYNPMSTKFR